MSLCLNHSLRHWKLKTLTTCVLCALFFLSGCSILEFSPVWPPRGWKQSEYGSFSPDVTNSFDGKYYAVQTLDKPEGSSVNFILVTIYDAGTDAIVDSFLTERAFDFWGVCWESDNYNLWIQSADIGTYCMIFEDGHWSRDVDASSSVYFKEGFKYQEATHPRHMPDEIIDRFRMRNGSFEYYNAYSPSGRYFAERGSNWDESLHDYINGIDIFEMADGKEAFFYPLIEGEYRGVCWEHEHDNLWVRLDDGVFCLRYENETWHRDYSAQLPDYIALSYNSDEVIKR